MGCKPPHILQVTAWALKFTQTYYICIYTYLNALYIAVIVSLVIRAVVFVVPHL